MNMEVDIKSSRPLTPPPKKFYCPDGPKTPPEIYENRRLPKILSFDAISDENALPTKRLRIENDESQGFGQHLIEIESRSRKVPDKIVKKVSSTSTKKKQPYGSLSPISESSVFDLEFEDGEETISRMVSEATLKTERKLFRDSIRNKKFLRKTTLIKGIKELIDSGVQITDEDRQKFQHIKFTKDERVIKLNIRPRTLKKFKTKKFLKKFSSPEICEHVELDPPSPPEGNPPAHHPQPEPKHEINVYEILPIDLSACMCQFDNLFIQ